MRDHKRLLQGSILVIGVCAGVLIGLGLAQIGTLETTKLCASSLATSQWPKWLGCAMAVHENLAGGLIAAGGALIAGWLAWSAARDQIAFEKQRAKEDAIRGHRIKLDQEKQMLQQIHAASRAASKFGDEIKGKVANSSSPSPHAAALVELARSQKLPITFNWYIPIHLGENPLPSMQRITQMGNQIAASALGEPSAAEIYLATQEAHAIDAIKELETAIKGIADAMVAQVARVEEAADALDQAERS